MAWRGYYYMEVECPRCGEGGKGCGYKFGVNAGLSVATYKLGDEDEKDNHKEA